MFLNSKGLREYTQYFQSLPVYYEACDEGGDELMLISGLSHSFNGGVIRML